MSDWNVEEAEMELEQYIKDWVKKYQVRNAIVVDVLLRQTVDYHMRELCQSIEKQP